mgnify:CR=1 FL=1
MLDDVLQLLERLAPPRLAAGWDNTGLLLEGDRPVRRILVTIDLTEPVCAEAVEHDVDLVVAYHPPIFRGLKSLTRADGIGRSLLTLARRGVHVYSPHTALDAVPGGMNDWLLQAFPVRQAVPIEPDRDEPRAGVGRVATIEARPAEALLGSIRSHLGLTHLRVAGPLDRTVERVAVCPGSGGSVFSGLRDVDLLLTGEMSHHDVLAWVARGTVVVLTEHTNTERGYLPQLAADLAAGVDGTQVRVATSDRDPLTVF